MRESSLFGAWLEGQLRRRDLNQTEFANAVGVSTSTVSRWLGDRQPDASYADRIADALQLDVSDVMAKMGYLPASSDDGDSPELRQIIALLRRVQLTEDRAAGLEGTLRSWIEFDRKVRR